MSMWNMSNDWWQCWKRVWHFANKNASALGQWKQAKKGKVHSEKMSVWSTHLKTICLLIGYSGTLQASWRGQSINAC